MEFIDNTGHIFSLPTYREEPIGYEFEENPYIFWVDSSQTSRLSVGNFYARVINMLFEIPERVDNINDKYSFEISCDSHVFTLLNPTQIQNLIDETTSLLDTIDIVSDKEDLRQQKLTNNDLYVIRTYEQYENSARYFLLIPIYVLCYADVEGTWSTNILVHITDNEEGTETWTPFTVGAIFIDEHEELVIHGRNMGISLPQDIIRAIYQCSFENDTFNTEVYNIKLKEYFLNYMAIRGECGNFKSAIDSLKWFGWGNKLTISKLMRTDNQFKEQYVIDYFDVTNDILRSFRTFRNTTYLIVQLALNHELDEYYEFDFDSYFWGENKPHLEDLENKLIKVNVGHDLDIPQDREKYWYWAPYFNFTFNELGMKLACLKYHYDKYFLPVHLKLHEISMTYKVFANDVKLDNMARTISMEPPVNIGEHINDVRFPGNGVHYFTKQIHIVDDMYNEFKHADDSVDDVYIINDTCTNIPIQFLHDGYFNCVMVLERVNKLGLSETIYESHFSFNQHNDATTYSNFIIYPKMINASNENFGTTKYINDFMKYDYMIHLLVNNRWYEYKFVLKIPDVDVEYGTLKYTYWMNNNNYMLYKLHSIDNDMNNDKHHIMMLFNTQTGDEKYLMLEHLEDEFHMVFGLLNRENESYVYSITPEMYEKLCSYTERYNTIAYGTENDERFMDIIRQVFIDNDDDFYFDDVVNQDYDNVDNVLFNNYTGERKYTDNIVKNTQIIEMTDNYISNFCQVSRLTKDAVIFNSYMNDTRLANNNNINFDFDYFRIIKYHLDNNLHYIDGKYIDNRIFYRYIFTPAGQKIILQDDLIGRDIVFTSDVSKYDTSKQVVISRDIIESTRDIIVFIYGYQYFILEEISNNSNTYEIITGEVFASNDEYVLLEDSKEDTISIDSDTDYDFVLTYDKLNNQYVDRDGVVYYIYERLNQTKDEIISQYAQQTTITRQPQYMNSLHLFNLSTIKTKRENVLIFENYIDMTCNGIIFQHDRYNQYDEESLKFYISGTPYKSNNPESNIDAGLEEGADTRHPDLYSQYWQQRDVDVTEWDVDEYVYYIQLDNLGEEVTDPARRFVSSLHTKFELPDSTDIEYAVFTATDEYANAMEAFDAGVAAELIPLEADGEIINIYPSREAFDEAIEESQHNITYGIYIDNDKYKFQYSTTVEPVIIKYNIISYVKRVGNSWVEYKPTLNDFKNKTIEGIKIKFKYNEYISVKNKEVTYTGDLYVYDAETKTYVKNRVSDTDEYYAQVNYQGNDYYVLLSHTHYIKYYDHRPWHKPSTDEHPNNFMVRNMNPSQYWGVLYDYTEQRYKIYDDTEEDGYTALYQSMNLLDREWNSEDTYFKNYLTKTLTGISGTYILDYETGYGDDTSNERAAQIKLKVAITDADGNKQVIDQRGEQFELTGDELDVTVYFQIEYRDIEDYENEYDYFSYEASREYWIKPKLIKVSRYKELMRYDVPTQDYDDTPVEVQVGDSTYLYGYNTSQFIVNLYRDFFVDTFHIYSVDNIGELHLLRTLYDSRPQLDMYLDYDFYLMHDAEYWYGIFISRQTLDMIHNSSDLIVTNREIHIKSQTSSTEYVLDYVRSDTQMLINRMRYIPTKGINHFRRTDIIVATAVNNDRLPINMQFGTKWDMTPVSFGRIKSTHMDSNSEMTILPINGDDNLYTRGYYDVIVRYSLDRDIQYQLTKHTKIRID